MNHKYYYYQQTLMLRQTPQMLKKKRIQNLREQNYEGEVNVQLVIRILN